MVFTRRPVLRMDASAGRVAVEKVVRLFQMKETADPLFSGRKVASLFCASTFSTVPLMWRPVVGSAAANGVVAATMASMRMIGFDGVFMVAMSGISNGKRGSSGLGASVVALTGQEPQ